MATKYPLEALLRPPVERYSAIAMFTVALCCLMTPSFFFLTPSVSFALGFCLLGRGIYRWLEAREIIQYQKNLRRLPAYLLAPQKIMKSNKYWFLGKGFVWTPQHTQRLHDAKSGHGTSYTADSNLYRLARRAEVWFSSKKRLRKMGKILAKDSVFNPVRPLPDVGGSTLIHGVEPKETTIVLDLSERVGHVGVYGTTRQGKSRLCEGLMAQDIAREDSSVVCVDPKGDAGLLKRMYIECKRANRPFYIFHLGFPDISCRYNAIGSFSRISEVATRATSQISGEGSSAAFKEFCWRFSNIISQARVRLGDRPTYEQITQDIMNIEPLFEAYMADYLDTHMSGKKWRDEVAQLVKDKTFKPPRYMAEKKRSTAALDFLMTKRKIFDPVAAGLLSTIRYDKTYFDKIVASLLPQLERLTSGRLAELISPDYSDLDDNREIIDWMTIIRKKACVYIGLDAMTDIDTSSTVASALFADLLSTSGFMYKFGQEMGLYNAEMGKKPLVDIHGDEFNEYCGCFGPLLNKAGGSGVRMTLYTQTRSDLEVGTESPARAGVLEGNMNTLVMMRVKGKQTAELLTDQLGTTHITQLTQVTAANDSSDVDNSIHFTSKNEDRVTTVETDLITANDVMELPKGQAFVLTKGNVLSKVRFPLLMDNLDNIQLPDYIEDMCEDMRARYKTGDEWWLHTGGHARTIPNDIDLSMLSQPFEAVMKDLAVHEQEQTVEVGA